MEIKLSRFYNLQIYTWTKISEKLIELLSGENLRNKFKEITSDKFWIFENPELAKRTVSNLVSFASTRLHKIAFSKYHISKFSNFRNEIQLSKPYRSRLNFEKKMDDIRFQI